MKIIPYVHIGREYSISDYGVISIFEKMQNHNLVRVVFSGGEIRTPEQFLKFFKNTRNVIHIMVEDGECVLLSWLNRWGHNHAFCHFCMFPEIWGKRTIEVAKISLEYLFSFESDGKPLLDVILSRTSAKNKLVNKFAERMGFHHVGVIPGIMKDFYTDSNQDAVFKYIKREDVLCEKYTPM